MTEREFKSLLSRYLDGVLDDEEVIALKEAIEAVPNYRHRYQRALRTQTLMYEVIKDRMEERKLHTSEEVTADDPIDQLQDQAGLKHFPSQRVLHKRLMRTRARPALGFLYSVAAAFVLVATVTILFMFRNQPQPIGECLYVSNEGHQELIRGQSVMPMRENMVIMSGDRIVNRKHGRVMLGLQDGSMVSLEEETELSLPGSDKMQVALTRGEIMMEVVPVKQGANPFLVRTPDSLMTVLGTMFSVKADGQTTRLNVYEGKVRLARLHDHREVELETNTYTHTDDPDLNIHVIEERKAEVKPSTTMDILPTDDGYMENGRWQNTKELRVEGNRRQIYLRFQVSGVSQIKKATLSLTQVVDQGAGMLRFFEGSHSDWSENHLTKKTASNASTNAPRIRRQIARRKGGVFGGQTIQVDVTDLIAGDGDYTLIIKLDQGGARDIWFSSKEGANPPILRLSY